MQFVNIHDAKRNLSRYIKYVVNSNEPIAICQKGKPIAQLIKYTAPRQRKLGLLKGKIKIREDFDQLPKEFIKNFE